MDAKRVQELVDNPNFIKGIYNYCDRWCERCPRTSQCSVFAIDSERAARPEERDRQNEAYWRKVADIFAVTMDLLKESAERYGIDLDSLNEEPLTEPCVRQDKTARTHPCAVAAQEYATRAGLLLESLWESQLGEGKRGSHAEAWDAREVIRWYQHMIFVKIARALRGQLDEGAEEYADAVEDSLLSAKVALIAIDRSIAAWAGLRKQFRSHEDKIFEMLVWLDRLRRAVEPVFPSARTRLRPGFEDLDRNSSQE